MKLRQSIGNIYGTVKRISEDGIWVNTDEDTPNQKEFIAWVTVNKIDIAKIVQRDLE